MNAALLASLTMLIAGADSAPPAVPEVSERFAPQAAIQTQPWNPDLHAANLWPYEKPVHIDTDYCGPPGDFWITAEYYLWGTRAGALPPLVTSGPAGSGGALGTPGVSTLFGDSAPDPGVRSGGRLAAGVWFNSSYTAGFEGSYFVLADGAVKFTALAGPQAGTLDLARPFFNTATGAQAALLVASPGVASGFVDIRAPTRLQGGEATLVWNCRREPTLVFDVLTGFRYLELTEGLASASQSTLFATGTRTDIFDQFAAHNHFYGGQLGGRVEYRWRSFVCTLTEKLGLGANTADIRIEGSTGTRLAGGVVTRTAAGLLAQPSNIGTHSSDTFALVNELAVQAGWQPNDYLQLFLGYILLYDSSVIRAGDLVDLIVNPAQPAGPTRPLFISREAGFWAQGLNAGFQLRY